MLVDSVAWRNELLVSNAVTFKKDHQHALDIRHASPSSDAQRTYFLAVWFMWRYSKSRLRLMSWPLVAFWLHPTLPGHIIRRCCFCSSVSSRGTNFGEIDCVCSPVELAGMFRKVLRRQRSPKRYIVDLRSRIRWLSSRFRLLIVLSPKAVEDISCVSDVVLPSLIQIRCSFKLVI